MVVVIHHPSGAGAITKVHTTAVVLCLPQAVSDSIQVMRVLHDRNAERWMPHVTLLYPFVPYEGFESVLPKLSAGCRAVQPFDLSFERFRTFRSGRRGHTLWLDPEPGAPVIELQRALWAQLPDYDDVQRFANGFTPHLSVGQSTDDVARDRALLELRESWTPATFRADRIALIWRRDPPDDRFRVYREILLGTGDIIEQTEG